VNDHFDDCGTWSDEECDCPVRFIDQEANDE
jgi:hypothetical protein